MSTELTLELGDCMCLLPRIEAASVDAVVCDLPYGTTQCAWDTPIDLAGLWVEYGRVLKPGGVVLLFGAQPFTSSLVLSKPEWFRHIWYWEREKGTNFLSTKRQPLRVVEEIAVFAPTSSYRYFPQMVPLERPYRHTLPIKRSDVAGGFATEAQDPNNRLYKTYTHAHPRNLLRFARDKANRSLVPTQKPVALLEYLLRTYTKPGDHVLDNTMGSGTTGVACRKLGRRFTGMEMNAAHYEIAKQRIEATPPSLEEWIGPAPDVLSAR